MKNKTLKKKECAHPMNDSVILTHSTIVRNHMGETETATMGYFCPEHDRFGSWVVTKHISMTEAVKGLLERDE